MGGDKRTERASREEKVAVPAQLNQNDEIGKASRVGGE